MVEEELKEILTEYKSIAESEHSGYVNSIVNNVNFPNLVFQSLQQFEDRTRNVEVLSPLCDLLYNIYRRDPEYKYFVFQFLPHLTFVYLVNYGDKEQFGCIETWLIGIHNIESKESTSFRIPSLAQNSIYHEAHQISESRINSLPEIPGEKNGIVKVEKVPPPQVQSLNSQNKMAVISYLFSVYCNLLVDMPKQSVEYTCKTCSRMVTRGFSIGTRKNHRRNLSYGSDSGIRSPRIIPNRLNLSSSLLLELLQLSFFAIFNQSYNAGLSLIRDVEFRAKHGSMDSVLLVSRALLKMAPNGLSVEEKRYISTPSQLSKNIITNASFRTKKLEGDIPRIELDDEGGNVEGGKMGVISEEGEEVGQDGKKTKDGENIADKIKAKMENVRIPNIRKKEKEKERTSESENFEKAKGGEKKEKKKDKKEGKGSTETDGSEEIRMQTLPSETIAIHSPESGSTSIF